MAEFQVGKPYNPNVRHWQEAVQYTFRGGQHELTLFFRNPQLNEVQAVERGRKEFALVVDGDVIVFLFRFSGANPNQRGIPWSDCPYSWHLLPPSDQQVLPVAPANMTSETRAAMHIFLVNADTGIILAMRPLITLSHEFTVQLHQAILAQIERPFDKVRYDRQVRALQARYQSQEMVRLAVARCEGGT
jgi:hypothetical protein